MSFDMPRDEEPAIEVGELAFEHGDIDVAHVLYRVVHRAGKRGLRMTNYFTSAVDRDAAVERIDPANLILAQEFHVTSPESQP